MKKKMLFLGRNDSVWLRFYLNNVFGSDPNDYEVIVFDNYNETFDKYCKENNYSFVYPHSINPFVARIPIIRGLSYGIKYYNELFKLRKRIKSIYAIHIHYVDIRKLRAVRILRKIADKVICTFWGSDLYRTNEKLLQKEMKYFRLIDTFTFSSKDMQAFFCRRFGNCYDSKSRIVRFGIEALDSIHALIGKEEICKGKFDLPQNKIIITIGYNGAQCQQHLEVLRVIEKFPQHIKDKIFLVIPIAYGLNQSYYLKLNKELEMSGCCFRCFSEFMDSEIISYFRVSTDVFIHAQTSDAFSASVQEYLYAEKLVFNPSWIRYSIIKERAGFFIEYSSFDELKEKLLYSLENYDNENIKQLTHINQDIIYSISSWSVLRDMWYKCYLD